MIFSYFTMISTYKTKLYEEKYFSHRRRGLFEILRVSFPALLSFFVSVWIFSSRKHEYEKHGTCAARIKGFEHEHDYFQRTLEMREKYSIERYYTNIDIFFDNCLFDFTCISNVTIFSIPCYIFYNIVTMWSQYYVYGSVYGNGNVYVYGNVGIHANTRYRFFKFLKNFVEALSQGFSSLEKFNDWKMFNYNVKILSIIENVNP